MIPRKVDSVVNTNIRYHIYVQHKDTKEVYWEGHDTFTQMDHAVAFWRKRLPKTTKLTVVEIIEEYKFTDFGELEEGDVYKENKVEEADETDETDESTSLPSPEEFSSYKYNDAFDSDGDYIEDLETDYDND